MQLDFPLQINGDGRTKKVNEEEHIRQLIEQVLFTVQGERINRPAFGSGINQLVFAPNSQELATSTQLLIQAALQQWLGDIISVESVIVRNNDSRLDISIKYVIITTQQNQTSNFIQAV